MPEPANDNHSLDETLELQAMRLMHLWVCMGELRLVQ